MNEWMSTSTVQYSWVLCCRVYEGPGRLRWHAVGYGACHCLRADCGAVIRYGKGKMPVRSGTIAQVRHDPSMSTAVYSMLPMQEKGMPRRHQQRVGWIITNFQLVISSECR